MNALFNQVINCKFIKNIKINKMEDKVNKLIEKIENDTIQHYMFDDVLNMLKDLLVSNKNPFYCNSEIFNKKLCKHQCESCYFKSN